MQKGLETEQKAGSAVTLFSWGGVGGGGVVGVTDLVVPPQWYLGTLAPAIYYNWVVFEVGGCGAI